MLIGLVAVGTILEVAPVGMGLVVSPLDDAQVDGIAVEFKLVGGAVGRVVSVALGGVVVGPVPTGGVVVVSLGGVMIPLADVGKLVGSKPESVEDVSEGGVMMVCDVSGLSSPLVNESRGF